MRPLNIRHLWLRIQFFEKGTKKVAVSRDEEGDHLLFNIYLPNLFSVDTIEPPTTTPFHQPKQLDKMVARISAAILLIIATISPSANAFSTAFVGSSRVAHRSAFSNSNGLTMRVVDIDSEAAFDTTVSTAGDSLVVVDYSTTWCGPCKGTLCYVGYVSFGSNNKEGRCQ